MKKLRDIVSQMGPGLLMAGAAIGVSHLVQSTRAGASFGYQLIWVVVLTNLLKYPFFEFGHRYATVTGENLLQGYKKMGKVFLYAFLLLSSITSIGTMAGVTFVTGALAYNLFGEVGSVGLWCSIVMFTCALILSFGHYKFLDKIMKVIMLVLFIATGMAFFAALSKGMVNPNFSGTSAFSLASVPFLIALMGWMPAPVETSVWQSLWVQAKNRVSDHKMTLDESNFDFNFGYFSTIILAVMFLMLGALVMYGSGESFSSSGASFTSQVISLYTQNLGEWAKPVIALAAFSTMFSTTITCLDAYSRSLSAAVEESFEIQASNRKIYYLWLSWSALGGLAIILFFTTGIKTLIDLVTTIAFLTAPLFAFMNYKLIYSSHFSKSHRPNNLIRILCWLGLTYLFGFSLYFLSYRFF